MTSSLKYLFNWLMLLLLMAAATACAGFSMNKEEQTPEQTLLQQQEEKTAANKEAMAQVTAQSLKPVEYLSWIENKENGLHPEKIIGNFKYSAFYQPFEYLLLKELPDSLKSVPAVFEERKHEYQGMEYVSYRIECLNEQNELLKINLNSENEYFSRIEYFSFKAQNEFKLINGKDTLPCAFYHFERVFGLAPYITLSLGFPVTGNTRIKEKYILFEDKTFKNGSIYLNIPSGKLAAIPKLAF